MGLFVCKVFILLALWLYLRFGLLVESLESMVFLLGGYKVFISGSLVG